jgi:flavin reductase (DIM6/NTAB) family NADH-FMN oxidoreductase RutF
LAKGRLISKYDLVIGEVVKAHVAGAPTYPQTLHYRGQGVLMISGASIGRCKKFKAERL